ncbi:MAG TPA: DUF6691 family protein [Polyangiaceae bacterium]|nr:DUF6691 family protein [Polyangiaceae bacterium]
MQAVLTPIGLGILFGWALHKAGLTQYARIVNVYRLRDLTVIRFMLTALVVGAVAIQCGVDLGLATAALPVPPTSLVANVVGGAVFGVGMASAGYCPGTIVAEAGEGRLDALFAGFAGLIAGALLFGLVEPFIMPALTRVGGLGRVTFADLVGAKPWLALLVFAELVSLLLFVTRRAGGECEQGSPMARP